MKSNASLKIWKVINVQQNDKLVNDNKMQKE